MASYKVLTNLSKLLDSGIKEGIFPCAIAGISYQNKKYIIARGYKSLTPFLEPVEDIDIFDLASLTKPLALAFTLIYLLSQNNNKINIFKPIKNYLNLISPLGEVPIYRFLNHTSGLKAWYPFYEMLINKEFKEKRDIKLFKIIEKIEIIPLEYTPGKGCIYSDLGYFVLTYLLEKIYKKNLENLFEEAKKNVEFSKKSFLGFKPLEKNISQEMIVPTSVCPWSKKILRGLVEDENTRALDGVSGVAGLFGNIYGVLDILEFLLLAYKEGTKRISSEIVKLFFEFKESISNFSLGFMHNEEKTIGHLGFTGCSFFIYLKKDLIVVLLTNRVYLDRSNQKIREFRKIFHEKVLNSLLLK